MGLSDELARCDREIAELVTQLRSGEASDHPGGHLLGLYDWSRERELILKEMEKATRRGSRDGKPYQNRMGVSARHPRGL